MAASPSSTATGTAEPSVGLQGSREPHTGHRARAPRALHPGAWWIWALGMGTAATRTTNPLLLAMILGVLAVVVAERRGDAPWAKGFRYYLYLALFVIGLRVVFRMLFDAGSGTTILFTLPELSLPDAAAGVRIGGSVSAEGVVASLYDGLRLATLLVCIGSANVLANPKRLLRSVPSALFEIGVAVTVALSVAPQLVESAQRVHRARRLRGEAGRRTRLFREIVVPVMTDALERSIALAAAMDSRGYGRTGTAQRGSRRATAALVLGGLLGVCVGTYGLLDATAPRLLGLPVLFGGLVVAAIGFGLSGRRVQRTRYRPDPWSAPEWGVSLCGVAVAAVFIAIASSDPTAMSPAVGQLAWPTLPAGAALGLVIGLLPARLAPPMPRSGAT